MVIFKIIYLRDFIYYKTEIMNDMKLKIADTDLTFKVKNIQEEIYFNIIISIYDNIIYNKNKVVIKLIKI